MINKTLLKDLAQKEGLELDDLALERYDKYAELLVEWNKVMNLTGITEPDEIVVKHFVDCLMLAKHFDLSQTKTMIDVGTGAGFPAIPLLIYNPELEVTLMDSLNKRLNFLAEVLKETGLNANIVHGRAEDFGQDTDFRETYDLATARAVAPMNVLCEYCLPFVKVGGYFVALKGSNDDTTEAMEAIKELGGELISNVSYKLNDTDTRSIVVIKKISQTSTKYPRKTKKITQKPL